MFSSVEGIKAECLSLQKSRFGQAAITQQRSPTNGRAPWSAVETEDAYIPGVPEVSKDFLMFYMQAFIFQ